jgi:membrane-bound lytic murein transglycosylase A
MPDGRILRLAYADQNGHAFRPLRVSAAPGRVTRGLVDGAEPPVEFTLEDDDEADTEPLDDDADDAGTARGLRVQAAPSAGHAPAAPRPARPQPAAPRPAAAAPSALRRTQSDPSYVFFRVAPNQSADAGPVGALGVPLTAGRSIAVDPRVLPLGYPVYMAAQAGKGTGQALRKLVFAQDTGGAIRGAVRADHFWGFGAAAMRAAYATRHRGGLWLMLPSTEYQQLRSARVAKRSLGASPVAELDRACLVPDEAHCFEPDTPPAPN